MKYTVRDACDIAYKKITAGKVRAKVILIVLQGSLKIRTIGLHIQRIFCVFEIVEYVKNFN